MIEPPAQENAQERALRELAQEYHQRTEAFDRRVCTGPVRHGSVLPANAWERAEITRNASAVYRELGQRAAAVGASPRQWQRAVGENSE